MTSLPILLPDGYTPTVKSGDSVAVSQIIAKKTTTDSEEEIPGSAREEIVDLPVQLGLMPEKIGKTLTKNPGDSVAVGEVLATKKQSFGLKELKVISQAAGTILRFERDTGRLIIRLDGADMDSQTPMADPDTILSPVAGTVSSVDKKTVTIATEQKATLTDFGSGAVGEGELMEVSAKQNKDEYVTEITGKAAGFILAVPSVDKQIIAKCDALGVAGIICLELAEDVVGYLNSRSLTFPLVKLSEEEYKKIVKQIGKRILLNGETRSIIVLAS
jgi:hypothetical protein